MKNIIKILTVTLIIIFAVSLSVDLTLAAPKGNNGKGNGKQGQGSGNGNVNNNNGGGNGKAGAQAAVNNSRKHANVRANRPAKEGAGVNSDKLAKLTEKGRRSKAGEKGNRGIGKKGKDFFAALGRARWSYNPHDERGQGNMGKPAMRDPYGHDKDSGREKSERGRPIKESDTTQASLEGSVNIDFASLGEYQSDALMQSFQNLADYYAANWDSLSLSNYYTYEEWHNILYKHFFPDSDATGLLVNHRDSIDYNLSVGDYSSDSLTVTTTLTSVQDYDSLLYTYDSETGTWIKEPISYSSGDVIFEQTQEVTLDSENNLLDYSQDLPGDIMGTEQNSAFYVELNVTVTDTNTGATYTQTYDNALYLYRCPYGKVTNKMTGMPVAGAKITVHFEDGSLVTLDRASNPTASNPQYTDATGRYGAKLRTNKKYYITAEAEGYKPYKSEVFTEKWHVLREDVALEPVEEAKVVLGRK
jgi:hypothetical protein